ncbi:MAG: hypothetical protein SFV52_03105 [Saprospiraceae bacterium]|nr:hypothetical protein [Saprospiraceae bacterium]
MRTFITILFLLPFCAALPAQDPPGDVASLEEVFRSSEQPGETPTGRRERHRVKIDLPAGAFRVGCYCMDGSFSAAQSVGACSGHGGVRYWLYRTPAADTILYPTDRHVRHPAPYSAAEMSEMARRSQFARHPAGDSAAQVTIGPAPLAPWLPTDDPDDLFDLFDWSDVAGMGVVGTWLYAMFRLAARYADKHPEIIRDALDHLLRRNRRPPAEPDGQNTDETRV